MAFIIETTVSLLPADGGGLLGPFPNPTPSLMLIFKGSDDEPLLLTASIEVSDADAVLPGAENVRAEISFLKEDEARLWAIPGTRFNIWYAGRIVGNGEVIEEVV